MSKTQCPNSHNIEPGDAFCSSCGVVLGHSKDSSEPQTSALTDTVPVAGDTVSVVEELGATCPAGHPVVEGQRFCGYCGLRVSTEADPTAGDRRPGRRSRWLLDQDRRRDWLGLVVLVACSAVLAVGSMLPTWATNGMNLPLGNLGEPWPWLSLTSGVLAAGLAVSIQFWIRRRGLFLAVVGLFALGLVFVILETVKTANREAFVVNSCPSAIGSVCTPAGTGSAPIVALIGAGAGLLASLLIFYRTESRRQHLRSQLFLGIGMAAVVAAAVAAPLNLTEKHVSASASQPPATTPTTAESSIQQCEDALSPWAQYISNNSNSTFIAWLGAVGEESPIFQLPIEAMDRFQSEVYSVGNSQASTDMYDFLDNECSTFTANNPNFDWTTVPAVPNS